MYVLDSSAIIEAVNDEKQAEKIGRVLGDEPLVTTTICVHEVLAGASSDKNRFVFEKIVSSMQILEHTSDAARAGAEIQRELKRSGQMINPFDILIAAVCKSNYAQLVTFDNDFARVKGLKTIILK